MPHTDSTRNFNRLCFNHQMSALVYVGGSELNMFEQDTWPSAVTKQRGHTRAVYKKGAGPVQGMGALGSYAWLPSSMLFCTDRLTDGQT